MTAGSEGVVAVTQADVTDADKGAVTRFHDIQIKRIMAGDRTLGEDGRQTIEQAFAERRLAGIAEGRRLAALASPTAPECRGEWISRADAKARLDALIVAAAQQWGAGSTEHNLVRDVSDALLAARPLSGEG